MEWKKVQSDDGRVDVSPTGEVHTAWNSLYIAGAAAGLIVGALFLVGMTGLIAAVLQPDAVNGWLASFQNNWLVVLFELNAGFRGIQFDRLFGLTALDIVIMALTATMYVGLYAALRSTSKIGSAIAAVQPFLGIALFIATNTAGRSAVMGAGLVISIVMLRSRDFGKAIALVGILANVLLLAGDLGTTANSHSLTIAILIGIGYTLLTAWLFGVVHCLFRLGREKAASSQAISQARPRAAN